MASRVSLEQHYGGQVDSIALGRERQIDCKPNNLLQRDHLGLRKALSPSILLSLGRLFNLEVPLPAAIN